MKRGCRRWTDSETAFLRANYRALGAAQCAEHLNRTRQQIYDKARALRIGTGRVFERSPAGRVAPRAAAVKVPAEPPKPSAVYDSGFIRPLPLSRLMGGK